MAGFLDLHICRAVDPSSIKLAKLRVMTQVLASLPPVSIFEELRYMLGVDVNGLVRFICAGADI